MENHKIPKSLLTIIPGATNTDQFKPTKPKTAKTEVREKYSWPVVAEQLEAIYVDVAKKPLYHAWTEIYNMNSTVEDADLSCRFRQVPHLL